MFNVGGYFETLRGLLRRVAEEVEPEIRQVEKELAEARRGGAKRRAEELSAIRDILYEDKWFRIATAVYAHLKKLFAEDGKAAEVIETAERRLSGLRLEVIEVPLTY
jgi:C4-type Zn-finger protein